MAYENKIVKGYVLAMVALFVWAGAKIHAAQKLRANSINAHLISSIDLIAGPQPPFQLKEYIRFMLEDGSALGYHEVLRIYEDGRMEKRGTDAEIFQVIKAQAGWKHGKN